MKIVIITCDAYRKVWIGMEHALAKYWPDRPWPVYVITNEETVQWADETIKVGPEKPWYGWSDKMKAGLDQIEDEHILYLQEDYWFFSEVKAEAAEVAYSLMASRKDLNMIRLVYLRKSYGDPVVSDSEELLNCIPPTAKGRASLQAAIWRKQVFRDLLVSGEGVYDFDRNALSRCSHLKGFARLKESGVMFYDDGCLVRHGRWGENAEAYCEREGIEIPGLKVGVSVAA